MATIKKVVGRQWTAWPGSWLDQGGCRHTASLSVMTDSLKKEEAEKHTPGLSVECERLGNERFDLNAALHKRLLAGLVERDSVATETQFCP